MIPHLPSAWHVDQAIVREEERLVIIRFGKDSDEDCMLMDELLYKLSVKLSNFAMIYVCDNSKEHVDDFNEMYGMCKESLAISRQRKLTKNHRTLRQMYHYVFLSQQAYDVRFRHW